MNFVFEELATDSPYIQNIWRTRSERAGSFQSLAVSHWELVVSTHEGKTTITLRGPETHATVADCPASAEFFGIQFKLGTFMPRLPMCSLVDHSVDIPAPNHRSFQFHGATWEVPRFEHADTFVERMVGQGVLAYDPIVQAALDGEGPALSARSLQYRFVRATGLPQQAIRQIGRARFAADLIGRGVPTHDTILEAGYFDQAHMTRALKRMVGQTPGQIARPV
jgi:hypothetical protein